MPEKHSLLRRLLGKAAEGAGQPGVKASSLLRCLEEPAQVIDIDFFMIDPKLEKAKSPSVNRQSAVIQRSRVTERKTSWPSVKGVVDSQEGRFLKKYGHGRPT